MVEIISILSKLFEIVPILSNQPDSIDTIDTIRYIIEVESIWRNDTTNRSAFKAKSVAVSDTKEEKMADGREEQILEYAREHNSFTKNDIVDLLKISPSTAARLLRGLIERELLKRNGKARSTYYRLGSPMV